MGPRKLNKKDTDQSLGSLKELKKEKKKWKEKKLLKFVTSTNDKIVKPESTEEAIGNKINKATTYSIAVPGSILDNAQSSELRTYLAGQIARAACVFKVDEIVIFDDVGNRNIADNSMEEDDGKTVRKCCIHLARILQYLECPQYLRKYFFPIHKDLQYAGLLNPLDAPHHLRQNDEFPFREGITTNLPMKAGNGSIVNCGLLRDVIVDKSLTSGIRVTVKLLQPRDGSKKVHGIIVPPSQPSIEMGVYWGYTVRLAQSLGEVFSQSPYPDGYDLTIGTSDRGGNVDDLPKKGLHYNHAIIVFGGLQGLEAALDNDELLTVDDPALIFDHYLNTCPEQGSRTIRTEEAILISLAALRTKLSPKTY